MKKFFSMTLAIVLSLVLLAACGSTSEKTSSKGEKKSTTTANKKLEKVKLRVNWVLYGEHAPFFVALEKGYYKEAGLDVEIQEGDGSASTVKLVANKSVDIGYADASASSKGIVNGMPVKMVGAYMQVNPSSIIFKKEKGFKTPQDLIGKTIALTQGDAPSQVFDALLEVNNVDQSKVKKLSVGTPAAKEAAMLTDKADAFIGFYHDQAPRIEVNEKLDLDYVKYADFGITMYATGLVVHNDTIKNNPEMLKKFIKATNKGWEFTKENPQEAIDIFLKNAPKLNKEIVSKQVEQMITSLQTKNSEGKPLGWMAPKDQQSTIDTLQKYSDMGGSKEIADYFTNELNPE